jgi:hypothetical protein
MKRGIVLGTGLAKFKSMNLRLAKLASILFILYACSFSERDRSYSLSELPTFLSGSNEGSYEKSELIVIPYDFRDSKDLEVDEWLEIEMVVPLSDEYLLGGICKVLIWKDQFIIQDKSRETLVSYDFDGNLKWIFNKKAKDRKNTFELGILM